MFSLLDLPLGQYCIFIEWYEKYLFLINQKYFALGVQYHQRTCFSKNNLT